MKWNYDRRRDRWILFVVATAIALGLMAGIAALVRTAQADRKCGHSEVYRRSQSWAVHSTLTWAKIDIGWCVNHGEVTYHHTTFDEDSPGPAWHIDTSWRKTFFKVHHGEQHGSWHAFYHNSWDQCFIQCVDTDLIEERLIINAGRGDRVQRWSTETSPGKR